MVYKSKQSRAKYSEIFQRVNFVRTELFDRFTDDCLEISKTRVFLC